MTMPSDSALIKIHFFTRLHKVTQNDHVGHGTDPQKLVKAII